MYLDDRVEEDQGGEETGMHECHVQSAETGSAYHMVRAMGGLTDDCRPYYAQRPSTAVAFESG